MIPETLKIALGELGQKEIRGAQHNKRILEYQETTGLEFGDDETPWCSIFANWVSLQANLPRSKKPNARSWLDTGWKTSWPQPGDIVVFWRGKRNGWKGHVGFFMGYTKSGKSIYCIGGNQDDAVTVQSYPLSKVIGFRSLVEEVPTELKIPVGYIRKSESSDQVKMLQTLLARLNYLSENQVDGAFGELTEKALMKFQRDNNITVDGIYGNESRTVFERLFL